MDKRQYRLVFELEDRETGISTRVEKEFDQWLNTEFETIFQTLRECLAGCGYTEGNLKDYFGDV